MASRIVYVILFTLVTFVICEDDPERDLRGFTLKTAKKYGCYQIYNSTDKINASTCSKPHKKEKTSCALPLQSDENHCEIRTPSNESIIVPCYEAMEKYSLNPDEKLEDIHYTYQNKVECYMVRKGNEVKEVCPKFIDKDTAAITTPDNYTLIIKYDGCYSGKWLSTLLADRDFIGNFTFDPNKRSCYKVFTPEQELSDQTCSDDIESPVICVHKWDRNPNCTVLTTPNNETVVVDCMGGTNTSESCVEVDTDGKSTQVCVEELSQGCMGIITPSGLRLLFACRICRFDWKTHSYDKVELKQQRQFVTNILETSQYYKHKFEIWTDRYSWKQTIYPYWLPNTTCYGFKLDTNETVIFQCTDREFEKGCFKIIEPDEKEEKDICATVFKEKCAIINTPKGKRVFIGCYNALEYSIKKILNTTLTNYKNGIYPFKNSYLYMKMYKRGANCSTERVDYKFVWLNKYCWGVVTNDLEVITLNCPKYKQQNKTGCFLIYTQKYGPDGKILPHSYKRDKICAEIIDDSCVGIITPKGWAIQLDCFQRNVEGGAIFSVKKKEPTDLF